jgi:D-alanine-D-alanine ligase
MHPVIALLFGGQSEEHAISLRSAEAVWNGFKAAGKTPVLIGITKEGRWYHCDHIGWHGHEPELFLRPYANERDGRFWRADGSKGPVVDVLFPVLHGRLLEDGCLQGLLELAHIPYVGARVLGAAVGMDKEVSKRMVASVGVPVVPSLCLKAKPSDAMIASIGQKFGWPVFVKPAGSGSSFGVSKVSQESEFLKAFHEASEFGEKVLVEQAIEARELECAVLQVGGKWRSSSVVEITPQTAFYSFEAKYVNAEGAQFQYPAMIPPDLEIRIRNDAVQIAETLELRGLARVDFFLDKKTGALFFNEVNTLPGFTSISMFPTSNID